MSLKRMVCALAALLGIVLPLAAQGPKGQFLKAPLVFEPNRGQADPAVKFLSRANGHSVLLRESDAVFTFSNPAIAVSMKLVGQNPRSVMEGIDLQAGVTNYLVGNDRDAWRTSIPQFAKVKYGNVYPGIDLIYYGNERQLEYDFVVGPHIDPSPVQIEFEGVDQVSIDGDGDLILQTSGGAVRQQRPIAFQVRDGARQPVEARFILNGKRATFELGDYDRSLPLVIDPKFIWATYMGGPANDQGNDIVIDAAGNVYVTGAAEASTDDPAGVFTVPAGSGFQAFVTKINPAGAIVYTTYIGGSGVDESHSIAMDAAGNMFITGFTTSTDFPTVNAIQKTLSGVQDAYALKLDNNGTTILYSTYIGGGQADRAYGIAADPAGNAIIAGNTYSRDFPTASAFQSQFGGGLGDAFVAKFGPGGALLFSTFLGGNGNDHAYDVGRDDDGNIVATGFTSSQNFPVEKALYSKYRGGTDDAFVTKFSGSGSSLIFSTYLGGTGSDNGVRLALDKDKKIYVTGYTSSYDFPLLNPAQLFHGGLADTSVTTFDAFLLKLHADGQNADFSTYIGGEDNDSGTAISVDKDGYIYLAGWTTSLQFYAINALGGFLRGVRDGFVMKVAPDSSVVVFSSFLGGFSADGATSVASDSAANVYVTGYTHSFDFPLATDTMFQGATAGAQDGFIVKINTDDIKTSSPFTFNANGGFGVATAGQTANPIFGVATVDVASGLAPSGLAIIDLRSSGTLLNEVSLPVPELTHTGRFHTRTGASDGTALTLMNPGTEEVEVGYYFTAAETTALYGSFKLPAKSHSSSLLSQQPFNFPAELEGTTTFTTSGPVVAVALHIDSNTNTYVPIVDPYRANKTPLTIPHFVDGGGWTTNYHLVNPTETTITGEIRLFRNGEQAGVAAELATERGLGSVFTYSIPPRALYLLITRGESGDIITGYADIVPTGDSFAAHAYATLHLATNLGLSTTVESMPQNSTFRMYVESTGVFPEPLAASPAVVIANSSDFPVNVTLSLSGLDGVPSALSAQVALPPRGHFARFVKDIPGFENLPSPYYGVLRATTANPSVTVSGFRGRYNEAGQFLMLQTGPLKDVGNMNPIIFPHIVDGGGYATQFVLVDVAGAGASGKVNYLDPSGNPLNVAIAP